MAAIQLNLLNFKGIDMKKITMCCYNDDNIIEQGSSDVTRDYPDDVAWPSLVDQFNSFLCSMGYIPVKYNMFVEELQNVD